MAKTSYISIGSEIFGETSAGTRRNYVRDALGSVVAMTDTSNTKTYSARYKPYGDVLSSTGTAPSFTWVGVLGYLKAAGSTHNEFSVRARFYGSKEARWTRVDPLWPRENSYGYVKARPASAVDPLGLRQVHGGLGPICAALEAAVFQTCSHCYAYGPPSPECQSECDSLANAYYETCKGSREDTRGWHPGQGGIIPNRPALGPNPLQGPNPPPWIKDPSWGMVPCYPPGQPPPNWSMPDKDMESCEAVGKAGRSHFGNDGFSAHFNYSACKSCCEKKTPAGYSPDPGCYRMCLQDYISTDWQPHS